MRRLLAGLCTDQGHGLTAMMADKPSFFFVNYYLIP